jgi:formamidopyrimidine-DNA glycosylase
VFELPEVTVLARQLATEVAGRTVEKVQFLGGACYLCPACQR